MGARRRSGRTLRAARDVRGDPSATIRAGHGDSTRWRSLLWSPRHRRPGCLSNRRSRFLRTNATRGASGSAWPQLQPARDSAGLVRERNVVLAKTVEPAVTRGPNGRLVFIRRLASDKAPARCTAALVSRQSLAEAGVYRRAPRTPPDVRNGRLVGEVGDDCSAPRAIASPLVANAPPPRPQRASAPTACRRPLVGALREGGRGRFRRERPFGIKDGNGAIASGNVSCGRWPASEARLRRGWRRCCRPAR